MSEPDGDFGLHPGEPSTKRPKTSTCDDQDHSSRPTTAGVESSCAEASSSSTSEKGLLKETIRVEFESGEVAMHVS